MAPGRSPSDSDPGLSVASKSGSTATAGVARWVEPGPTLAMLTASVRDVSKSAPPYPSVSVARVSPDDTGDSESIHRPAGASSMSWSSPKSLDVTPLPNVVWRSSTVTVAPARSVSRSGDGLVPEMAARAALPPSTLWPALSETAASPRPSAASSMPPRTRIAPPFSVSASASTLRPSASTSDATTVCRKTSASVPSPDAYAAWRVAAPIASASRGASVTSTGLLNATVASIVSPRL